MIDLASYKIVKLNVVFSDTYINKLFLFEEFSFSCYFSFKYIHFTE